MVQSILLDVAPDPVGVGRVPRDLGVVLDVALLGAALAVAAVPGQELEPGVARRQALLDGRAIQIGRASCRERV